MTLRQARILSSETDNTIKQEQNTNVNIRIAKSQEDPINFTHQQIPQERSIADLGNELNSLEKKNEFLEMIVEMYEGNPLKINSYVVCDSKLLMDMIKLLTECEKVELVIDDSNVGCGCTTSTKFIKISKILVTKEGKTEDMKYAYNEIYSTFIKYGISLKLVV